MRELFDNESKREDLRETLHSMSVWNVYDTKIIKNVLGTIDKEGNPIGPKKAQDNSVSDYVRKAAVRAQISQR
jgi:hypothetical protein